MRFALPVLTPRPRGGRVGLSDLITPNLEEMQVRRGRDAQRTTISSRDPTAHRRRHQLAFAPPSVATGAKAPWILRARRLRSDQAVAQACWARAKTPYHNRGAGRLRPMRRPPKEEGTLWPIERRAPTRAAGYLLIVPRLRIKAAACSQLRPGRDRQITWTGARSSRHRDLAGAFRPSSTTGRGRGGLGSTPTGRPCSREIIGPLATGQQRDRPCSRQQSGRRHRVHRRDASHPGPS